MRRATKLLLVATIVISIAAGIVAFAIGRYYHVYSWRGWQVYGAMQRECHPIWKVYNFGGVRAGEDVEKVIARTQPVAIERNGRWTHLKYQAPGYFTGITATAYDGKMVFACAWSCSWTRLFFDELSEEQSLEYLGKSKHDPRRLGIVPVYRS